MSGAFQSNAFQQDAFQMTADTAGIAAGGGMFVWASDLQAARRGMEQAAQIQASIAALIETDTLALLDIF